MDITNLVMFSHDVFCGACDAYGLLMLSLELIGCMQQVNYRFIIQLDGRMHSFCCGDDFTMIMIFFCKDG